MKIPTRKRTENGRFAIENTETPGSNLFAKTGTYFIVLMVILWIPIIQHYYHYFDKSQVYQSVKYGLFEMIKKSLNCSCDNPEKVTEDIK